MLYCVYCLIVWSLFCSYGIYNIVHVFFFFKQKTAYEMRISDCSSDVCSSDLVVTFGAGLLGCIAGGMFITDVVIVNQFGEQPTMVKIAAEVIGALLVILVGRWLATRKTNASKESAHESA